jgi:hypothetical protein
MDAPPTGGEEKHMDTDRNSAKTKEEFGHVMEALRIVMGTGDAVLRHVRRNDGMAVRIDLMTGALPIDELSKATGYWAEVDEDGRMTVDQGHLVLCGYPPVERAETATENQTRPIAGAVMGTERAQIARDFIWTNPPVEIEFRDGDIVLWYENRIPACAGWLAVVDGYVAVIPHSGLCIALRPSAPRADDEEEAEA